jgi:acetolactate synthase-1/2/3 large subunit
LTGVATAQLAASPLIAVSGSHASNLAERQAFQDIDQVGMTRPVVKWAAEPPNASQIPFYLARAYSEANSARRGAVHLTIPVDLFAAEVQNAQSVTVPVLQPQVGATDGVIELLKSAQRPIIIAGSGVWWSGAERELHQFIEKTNLPLYTITMAKGVVSDEHPLCMGYADPALNPAARQAFQEADLFLVLGKRLDYRLALGGPRLFPADTRFVQIDLRPQELGMNRKLDLAICSDLKPALRAITDAVDQPWKPLAWLHRLRALRSEWQQKLAAVACDESQPMHPAAFHQELRKHLPGETHYAWDGGDFAHWGRALLPALHSGGWLRLGPLGTIGSALPNGLAMKMMYPDKPVAVITGDGSLGFYIAEMDTAVRHKLPIVIIVGNDAGWGLERELQSALTGPEIVACELRSTRYDIIMKGFGGEGETIETLDQIGPAVRRAFSSGVPYCLNAIIRGVRSPFTDWQIAGKKRS